MQNSIGIILAKCYLACNYAHYNAHNQKDDTKMNIAKKILKTTIISTLGYTNYLELLWHYKFIKAHKAFPNRKKPNFFNEKVRYRMKHDRNHLYTLLSDKVTARDYISNKIGDKFLVPIRYILDSPQDVLRDTVVLDGTVIKSNHGAGMVLVYDGRDKYEVAQLCNSWMKTDFSEFLNELHYSKITPRLIIEESLCDENGVPNDYKFHVFKSLNGQFNYVLQLVNGRFDKESRAYYLNGLEDSDLVYHHGNGNHQLPSEHKEILMQAAELSKKLCTDFDYVRVDWYVSQGKLYFGELTFTPGASFSFEFGTELEKKMGAFWECQIR